MNQTYSYSYRYDPINDVYFVRRVDGSSLNGYIPEGLVMQIINEKRSKVRPISDIQKTYHFLADGTYAFVDLNMRTFTIEEEEMVFSGEKIEPKGIQKVLSIFKRKR